MKITRAVKGQPRVIRAADWNTIAAAAERPTDGPTVPPRTDTRSQTVVMVRNDSDSDVDRGEILALDTTALITLAENEERFITLPTFRGVQPQEPDHVGLFAVALEPIASAPDEESDGQIGRCVIAGVVAARVALRTNGGDPIGDRFAEIDHNSYRLRSGSAGSARILLVEEVGEDDAWCYIQLGNNDGGFELAEVQSVGSTTLTCKWLDGAGAGTGSAFTVNIYSYTGTDDSLGTADLALTYPGVAVGEFVRVYRQPRVEWNGTAWVSGYWAVDRFDLADCEEA